MAEQLPTNQSALKQWVNATPARQLAFTQEGLLASVAERIWFLMQKQGVSKAELAKRLGCSKAHVTGLLSGGRNMTLRTLADISYALDCGVAVSIRQQRK